MSKARWIHVDDASLCDRGPVEYGFAARCDEGKSIRVRMTRRQLEKRVAELEASQDRLRQTVQSVSTRASAALNAVENIARNVQHERARLTGAQ